MKTRKIIPASLLAASLLVLSGTRLPAAPEAPSAKPTPAAENAAFETIKARYLRFLTGTRDSFNGPLGAKAAAEFNRKVSGPVKSALKFDFTKDASVTFMSFADDPTYKADSAVYSALLEKYALALAYAYNVEAPGNAWFHDPKVLDCYVRCLDYLYGRGIREGMTLHWYRVRMERKGAPQPPPGAANLPRMELRMGAYCQSVLLMEPFIRDKGPTWDHARALVKHLEMLGFTAGHVDYYAPLSNPPGYEFHVQSDAVQNFADTVLVSALLETDVARRNGMLAQAGRVFNDSLKVIPGWEDTIKPDFTGYHHRGIYGNFYTCGFIVQAATGAWLMSGTPYEVSAESKGNLRELIRTYRLYCQKYSMPLGIRGRMPTAGDTIKGEVFAAILIMASDAGLGDKDMKPVFSRLWDPQEIGVDFVFAGGRGKLFRGMGALDLLDRILKEAPAAEPDPSGFWTKPYGGLVLQRRDHWMAAAKGYSKYIWDYENGPPDENLYGQYASHGSLVIFSKGSPVSDIASGYDLEHGWDWYRIPGTTAVHFPVRPQKVLPHREFNSETFLGGTSADGRNGVFGMNLRNDKFADGTRIGLKARKSLFFVDDFILMLGSGIEGGDGSNAVETTLFQSVLAKDEPAWSFSKDGLSDPSGNRYYVADASNLKTSVGLQKSYRQDGKTPSEGQVAVAWLDHGLHPQDAGYEVGIGISGAAKKSYEVLQRDNRLHAVAFPDDQLVAQVFYEAGEAGPGQAPVRKVDVPCLVMSKKVATGWALGVTNPDLGLVAPEVKVEFKNLENEHIGWDPAPLRPVVLTLAGRWKPASKSPQVHLLPSDGSGTVLKVDCVNGAEVRLDLVPDEK